MAIYGGEIIRIMQPGTYSYSCDTAVDPIAPSLSAIRERDNRPFYSNRYVIRRPIRTASQTRVTVPEGLVITR